MIGKEAYKAYVLDDVKNYAGLDCAVRAGLLERLVVHRASPENLHPNPDDEFCNPEIGPNESIVHEYATKFRKCRLIDIERIQVQKMNPQGYMILNGHHRWLAAREMNIDPVRIQIVNPVDVEKILRKLERSNRNRVVAFDLDETLICPDESCPADRMPMYPLRLRYPQRLRKNIGPLFRMLRRMGFDVWILSGEAKSETYMLRLMKLHRAYVNGIINVARKRDNSSSISKAFVRKYTTAVLMGSDSFVWHRSEINEVEIHDLPAGEDWANAVVTELRKVMAEKGMTQS